MLRMRGHPAGNRECTRVRGRAPLGRATSWRSRADRSVRARRQGYAYPVAGCVAMSTPIAATPAERIVAALRGAAKQGQPALVAFLTAGYPSRAQFREHLSAVASAVDVVEIGVPFSDPMADGVTIQRSSEAALRGGVTLTW